MARRFPLYANRATSTTVASINDAGTTITLAEGDGAAFPSPGAGQYVPAVLLTRSTGEFEEINITARSGDVLTVERAQGGTTAKAWASGTELFIDVPARELHDAQGHVARSFPTMAAAVAHDDWTTVDGRFVLIAGPQGGLFTVDAAASGTADGGIVIDVNGGAQQITRSYEGPVRPEWWGVTGDGTTDDTVALQACLDSAAAIARGVEIRDGMVIRVTDTVTFEGLLLRMEGDAHILYGGTRDRSVLVIGGAADTVYSNGDFSVSVTSGTLDWSASAFVLVDLVNLWRCSVRVNSVYGGTIGVRCLGRGTGFAHNVVKVGSINDCQQGVRLTNDTGSTAGFCNENLFVGGSVFCSSAAQLSLDRWGIVITSEDGAYVNNNNNVWLKPSFELNAHALSGGAEAVPMWVEHGRKNRVENARLEKAATSSGLVVDNASGSNVVRVGYSIGADDATAFVVSGDSTSGLNQVVAEWAPPVPFVASSGFLPDSSAIHASSQVSVKAHWWGLSYNSSRNISSSSGVTLTDSYIEIPSTEAIGVTYEIENVREVQVDVTRSTSGGRVSIVCRDSGDSVISSPSSIGVSENSTASYNSSFGGRYYEGTDNASMKRFAVPSGTARVEVMFSGGSAAMRIESYELRFFPANPLLNVSARKVATHGRLHEVSVVATNDPASLSSTQAHAVGDTVYNVAPSASGTIGWVCTTAGTPGTWKAFGTIAS